MSGQVGWQVGQGLLPKNTPFPLLSLLLSPTCSCRLLQGERLLALVVRELKWLFKNFFFFIIFFGSTAYGILAPRSGIKLVAPCSQAES